MIKRVFHKGSSVLLALIVLFSTVSFTVEKHFCGDVLVDISVFTEAQKCGMDTSGEPDEGYTKKSCCKDVLDVFEGQNELKITSFEDFDIPFYAIPIASFHYEFNETILDNSVCYNAYSPPNLVIDIQLLDQVFLI